jgi:hypothetical protein
MEPGWNENLRISQNFSTIPNGENPKNYILFEYFLFLFMYCITV